MAALNIAEKTGALHDEARWPQSRAGFEGGGDVAS
jgi:hypothetical protein